jgi:hypothetical protein
MDMFGTTRGVATLAGAAGAGALVWVATQIDRGSTGGYWAAMGILAGAGLTMALSQLFGGWTKWGTPRISAGVFLIGFLPVLVVAGWVLLAAQPDANWFQRHINSWSSSISIDGPVDDLGSVIAVLAFGLGLVFGFTFDTSGPRRPGEPVWESSAREPAVVPETTTVPPETADSAPTTVIHDAPPAETAPEPAAEPETAVRH